MSMSMDSKHFFYYCRKAYTKNKIVVNSVKLMRITTNIHDFTQDNLDIINSKALKLPTKAFSENLWNYLFMEDLSDLEEYKNGIVSDYQRLFTLSADEIIEEGYFQEYINLYSVNAKRLYGGTLLTEEDLHCKRRGKDKQKYVFDDETVRILENLIGQIGIYRLYNENKELIYIGKSYNLGMRIISSTNERQGIYFDYSIIGNKADTDIYELYYIDILKPECNGNKHDDVPSFKLEELTFSEIYIITRPADQNIYEVAY